MPSDYTLPNYTLPNYTVRESRRAKHVSLKILVTGALEVVVPSGFDQQRIPGIIQRKQSWINRVAVRVKEQQVLANATCADGLPEQIALRAIAQDWRVTYYPAEFSGGRAIEGPNATLAVYGYLSDPAIYRRVLRQWMAHQAQRHLFPWLRSLSQDSNLPFKHASVRQQKTLWGSCSGQKTISLNCKLLFLPHPVVRYVLIHELCHTVHMNHSDAFWALVQQHEPGYQQLDTSLRDAHAWVPLWME
jgi:predicted metal-dependent hydrolase